MTRHVTPSRSSTREAFSMDPAPNSADPVSAAPLLVVMGVTGSGKSTVGIALALRLRVPFADADDFHGEANVAKMSAGIPLDDCDRLPWLRSVGAWLAETCRHRWGDELLRAQAELPRHPARPGAGGDFCASRRRCRGHTPAGGQPAGALHAGFAGHLAAGHPGASRTGRARDRPRLRQARRRARGDLSRRGAVPRCAVTAPPCRITPAAAFTNGTTPGAVPRNAVTPGTPRRSGIRPREPGKPRSLTSSPA